MHTSYVNIIKKYIADDRVKHSERVCDVAIALCNSHGANPELVSKAAILHDIAKNQTPETLGAMGILTDNYDECWLNYPSVWHAFVAPALIEFECPGESKAITEMVTLHTTGNADMSKEAMIIFVADFIEPERSHPKRGALHELAQLNLEQSVAWITQFSIEKLKKNVRIHPYTLRCWDYYGPNINCELQLEVQ